MNANVLLTLRVLSTPQAQIHHDGAAFRHMNAAPNAEGSGIVEYPTNFTAAKSSPHALPSDMQRARTKPPARHPTHPACPWHQPQA